VVGAPREARSRLLIVEREGDGTPFGAPEDTLERSFAFLTARRRRLPAGSFVFVLSDFLAPPSSETWRTAVDCGWDVVPVLIQDPVWEQSFPASAASWYLSPIRVPAQSCAFA